MTFGEMMSLDQFILHAATPGRPGGCLSVEQARCVFVAKSQEPGAIKDNKYGPLRVRIPTKDICDFPQQFSQIQAVRGARG